MTNHATGSLLTWTPSSLMAERFLSVRLLHFIWQSILMHPPNTLHNTSVICHRPLFRTTTRNTSLAILFICLTHPISGHCTPSNTVEYIIPSFRVTLPTSLKYIRPIPTTAANHSSTFFCVSRTNGAQLLSSKTDVVLFS